MLLPVFIASVYSFTVVAKERHFVGDIVKTPKINRNFKRASSGTNTFWNQFYFSDNKVKSLVVVEDDSDSKPSSSSDCGPNYSGPVMLSVVKQMKEQCDGTAFCDKTFESNGFSIRMDGQFGASNPTSAENIQRNKDLKETMIDELVSALELIAKKSNFCTNEEFEFGDLSGIFIPTAFRFKREESLPVNFDFNVYREISDTDSQLLYQFHAEMKNIQQADEGSGFGMCDIVSAALAGFVGIAAPIAGVAIGTTGSILCALSEILNN